MCLNGGNYNFLSSITLFKFLYLMQEIHKIVTLRNEETGTEDKYVLLNLIGQGRYAKVFRAQRTAVPSKLFAVKVIKIDSEQIKREYLKELNIIKNLPDCPNLVKIHKEHFESENNLYIFQEYCESGTLIQYRANKGEGHLSEDEIYNLFFQLCNGLITLLEAGIVHEDIKPANILKKGSLFKICDFGVSEMGECKETTTRKGTISYMPPEKLKSRRFLPNEKSDIYSLGVCLYEVIFAHHPYLKKKTSNYKEYLAILNEATQKPISVLMKNLGSSSLRLENFLKFLQKMIDLNHRTRVSLAELRQFIETTEPFKLMKLSEELIEIQNVGQAFLDPLKHFHESIVPYKSNNRDSLSVITGEKAKESRPTLVKSSQKLGEFANNEEAVLRQQILKQYTEQNRFIVDTIIYLIRGVDYIRKSNFNDMNISPTTTNIANVDLRDCRLSRYLKYIIYEFAVTLRKQERQVYELYFDEETQESLSKDKSYLENQFNKFLIESNFENKEEFGEELSKVDSLDLWREIARVLEECLENLTIIKQNRNQCLQSVIYCFYMPRILASLSHLTSIFSQQPIKDQVTAESSHNASIETGKLLLAHALELETGKLHRIREEIEKELESRKIAVLFDIEEDSGEIEIIQQEDLM